MLMKDKFQSKAVPRGTRTIWRYLGALLILFTFAIGQMWGTDYTIYQATSSGVNTANKTETGISVTFNSFKTVSNSPVTTVADATYGIEAGLKAPRWGGGGDGKNIKVTVSDNYTATITVYVQTSAADKTVSIKSGSESGTEIASVNCAAIGTVYRVQASDLAAGDYYIKAGNDKVGLIKLVATVTATGGSDTEAPTLSSSVPANSATNVAVEGTIVLTFSEALASVDASKFSLTGATIGTVAKDGSDSKKVNVPYSGAANEATVTLKVAAEAVADAAGNKSAALSDISFTTVAPAPAVCPSGLTISGTAAYTEGQTISLEAVLEAGNGEIAYNWYKGADLATAKAAGSIGTGTSFSKASCTIGDAGNYFCVATKATCSDAESAAYPVTVEEKTCPTSGVLYSAVVAVTSNQSIAASTSDLALTASQATVVNGTMSVYNGQSSAKNLISQQNSKYYFTETNGNTFFRVRMDCALQAGDVITAEIYAGGSDTRGLWFATGTTYPSSAPTAQAQRTGPGKIEYVVAVGDGIIGEQDFSIFRATGNSTYFNNFVITRPYNVTFVSDHGTAPTTPTKAVSFTLTELSDEDYDHTGWTADKAVKVGGETKAVGSALAVDATVELTDNTTFTATWAAKAPTFAVIYKANNGTSEADINDPEASTFAANTFTVPDGKMFAGWNTKADGEGTNYAVGAAVTEAITVYAKWVVDPTIRLILKAAETYSINTENFLVYAGTVLQNEEYTVDGRTFAKNFKLANTGSSIAGQTWANKYFAYDVASNSTDIKLYLYNKNSSAQNLYYQVIYEGAAAGSLQTENVASKGEGQVVNIPTITAAKGARIVFYVQSTDIRFCQVEVLENGAALPAFGTNGYEFSVPGRAATYNKEGVFDGFEFKTNAELKFISGQNYIALRNIDGSQYVKFTVATNIQLQVTTPNANKFYVSKTAAGDAEKDTQYGGSAATHNVNLHAGTYYIAPTVGSSGGEVRITKLAFATAPAVKTVTFNSNEGSSVEEQEVFAGEKAVEPEAPTKSGYRFVEWQLSGSAYDFDDAVTTDITLDAVWQKTWNVTFDADNGSDPVVVTVDNNQAVAQPVNPEKSGFDFVEWQLSGSAYDFATLVTDNIILKATWEVAQDDATLSALSYDGNAIDVASAEDVSGVQTYTYHLPWGSTIDPALISVTPTASTATMSSITYNSEDKQATFQVTSGNGTVTINYAIQFVIDSKRGTSIVKAVVSGGDQKAGFAATGIYGDKGYAYTRNNKKLDTADKFVGVKLISGKTFATGDKLFVVTSTDADMGYIEIYEEAEGTNLIKATDVRDASEGIEVPELAGYSEFYIVRKASTGDQAWNGFVDYVEVTREMNPAIKSFKFGDDAATIDEEHKTISIEVPYATVVTALTPTVEAYGNNGATYTPAGATDFTSPVVYTVTDGYNEFHTDYTVTVNIAAPSENADLASLAIAGYSIDFDPATTSYNVILDYGTTVLPTITYEVAEVGLATAVKVEGGVNGETTITVTPQAGVGYEKVYTINFSVSTTPKIVIYDGSTTMNIAETGSLAGFTWSIKDAKSLEKSSKDRSFDGKSYPYFVNLFGSATKGDNDGNTRYIEMTVPEGYVAKFRLVGGGNGDGSRSLFISKTKGGTLDPSIAYATTSSSDYVSGMSSALQLPGTYYLCCDNSIRLCELSVQLYPIDVTRDVTQGRFGTICYPNGGYLVGAMLLEIAYFDPDQKKIFFDEVIGGKMIAGAPYLFLPNEGVDKFAITYTDNLNAAAGHHNGLYGSYTQEALPTDGNHYIMLNNQYCKVVAANTYVGANRAYILLDKIGNDYVAPAYGRRRVSMSVNTKDEAQGFENLQSGDQPMKVMIDGTLYIIRGEKVFDATGRLVK